MPPRGRVGHRREDAALDAMKLIGFPNALVKRKLDELLNAYGEDGWIFIEEASYKVLIEAILDDQNEDQGESSTKLITYGDEAESSASVAALANAPHDADSPVESLVNQVSGQSTDVKVNKDNGEEAETSNKSVEQETAVGDNAQFAGGEKRIPSSVLLGVATSSITGQANGIMKNVSPKAAETYGVDKPNESQNIGNGSVSLAAHNVADHVETNVKSRDFQRLQSNDQPVKRRRKSYYGWYDGSEDRDIIDVSKFLSYKTPPTSELSGGTKTPKERKIRWDLKPKIL